MNDKTKFKVGDCLKSYEPMTQVGNVIVVGRKTDNEQTLYYILFTDYGNTITRTEEQLEKYFRYFNNCKVIDWLQDRNRLVAEQYNTYAQETSIL